MSKWGWTAIYGALTGNPAMIMGADQKNTAEKQGAANTAEQAAIDADFAKTGNLTPYGSATDMASRVLAAEYADWENTFKPLEMNLLQESSVNNPEVLTKAVGTAGTEAGQSFDSMAGVERRKLASYGIAPTAEEQQTSDRIRGLSKAAAVAGAENKARQQVSTQDQMISLGTAPNPQVVQQSLASKYANK